MASKNFTNLARLLAIASGLNWSTDTFKTMLVSAIPSEAELDSWTTRSNVTSEITGTGYTAGGVNQLFTLDALDTANNLQAVTWTNLVNAWTASTFSAVGAIIYKNAGSAATDQVVHFVDFGGTVSCSNGTFSVTYTSKFEIQA
jgi:hypothetical protein